MGTMTTHQAHALRVLYVQGGDKSAQDMGVHEGTMRALLRRGLVKVTHTEPQPDRRWYYSLTVDGIAAAQEIGSSLAAVLTDTERAARAVSLLVADGALSPAARDMDPGDALWQWVEANGFDPEDADTDMVDAGVSAADREAALRVLATEWLREEPAAEVTPAEDERVDVLADHYGVTPDRIREILGTSGEWVTDAQADSLMYRDDLNASPRFLDQDSL